MYILSQLYEEINSSISKSEEIILAHLVRQRLQIALALTRQISLLSFGTLTLSTRKLGIIFLVDSTIIFSSPSTVTFFT